MKISPKFPCCAPICARRFRRGVCEDFADAPCRVCPSLSYFSATLIFEKHPWVLAQIAPGSVTTWIFWKRPWILVQIPPWYLLLLTFWKSTDSSSTRPVICDPEAWKSILNFLVSRPQTQSKNSVPSNCATFLGCASFSRLRSIVDFLKKLPCTSSSFPWNLQCLAIREIDCF